MVKSGESYHQGQAQVADIFGSITESGSMVTETWAQVDGAEYIRHLFLQ